MNYKLRTKKAFTLIELVTAVALLALVLMFSGIIFKVSIESYRTASANAEIMQKLRVITEQLNADFKGLAKDGYLILHSEIENNRKEYLNSVLGFFRADRLYYFSTGDFQSWFNAGTRSNIARIYFGHDSNSIANNSIPVSKWDLARDIVLLTPGVSRVDCDANSYAYYKANPIVTETDANSLLANGVSVDVQFDPNNIRRLMCQNTGWMQIEWTDAAKDPNDVLNWFPNPNTTSFPYKKSWTPATPKEFWPRALKFTFTLYDSKNIIKDGRPFTHIVYLD